GGAFGEDLRTAVDHQEIGAGRAEHGDARLDGELTLARLRCRVRGVSTHVLADVGAAVDRVDDTIDLRQYQLADDARGQLAVGHASHVTGVGGAIRAFRSGRRRRGRR